MLNLNLSDDMRDYLTVVVVEEIDSAKRDLRSMSLSEEYRERARRDLILAQRLLEMLVARPSYSVMDSIDSPQP
jgi:hypothetical protein